MSPAAIKRPDGRLYQPRKVIAHPVTDPDDGDMITGVVVLGTHNIEAAQYLADEYVRWQYGSGWAAVTPGLVWWRDGLVLGRRTWVSDKRAGRAGVWFAEIAEVAP